MTKRFFFITLISLAAMPLMLSAQSVPALINYQGQLLGASGTNLPAGDYVLRFSIHDAPQGGSLVWGPQIFNGQSGPGYGPKIPVVQGYFNVMLGPEDAANPGRSLAEAFNGATRYIEIQVGNNSPLSPRQQILSAPYSLRAQDSANIGGKSPSNFVTKAGDTMTGTLNLPSDGLKVGDSQLVVANGKVGIGTANPAYLLHLNNGVRDSFVSIQSSGAAAGIGFEDSSGNVSHWIGKERALVPPSAFLVGDAPEALVFAAHGPNPIQFGVNTKVVMTMADGGNVGIGTTTPVNRLQVHGNAAFTGYVGIGTTSPTAQLHVTDSIKVTGSQSAIVHEDSSGALQFLTGLRSDISPSLDFVFHSYRNNWFFDGGYVGIGRTPQANILEVAGNASKSIAGQWLANSDALIKQNVASVSEALETLDRVRLVSFHYTEEYRRVHPEVEDREYLNVIAQEFAEVFPDAVHRSGEKLNDGHEILQVDTHPLTIYSAAAVQELHQIVRNQQAGLLAREREINSLEKRVADLERLVSIFANGKQRGAE